MNWGVPGVYLDVSGVRKELRDASSTVIHLDGHDSSLADSYRNPGDRNPGLGVVEGGNTQSPFRCRWDIVRLMSSRVRPRTAS